MSKRFKPICRKARMPEATIQLLGDRLTKADVDAIAARENTLEIKNEGDIAHLSLKGSIGQSWHDDSGITEGDINDALESIPAGKKIYAHINSEGGSVKEGLGIYNSFKARAKDITAIIDGYAVSIASVIPLAASKVVSPKSAVWMIHRASAGVYGNAEDGKKFVNMMEQHDTVLAEIYAEHTGKSVADCMAAMSAETWIRGSEAVDWGLADESGEDESGEDASAEAKLSPLPKAWLDRCKNIPVNIFNAISAPKISAPMQGADQTKTTEQIMNKTQMLALLNKWGVTVPADATDEQLIVLVNAGPKPAAPAPAAPPVAAKPPVAEAALDAVSAKEFRDEKRRRIRAEVARLGDNRVPNDKIDLWTDRALAAEKEESIYDEISAMARFDTGGDPVGFNRIESMRAPVLAGYQGQPTDMVANLFKENTTTAKRYDALRDNWDRLFADATNRDRKLGRDIRAENNFAGAITTNFLIMGAITKLGPRCTALKAFSRDNSVDPYKPLASGIQKFNTTVQDGSDTQTDATDFTASSDSILTGPAIAVHQYTQGMHLTNAQLNSGVRMDDLLEAKLGSFLSKIVQVATAPITVANFSTLAPDVVSSAAFGFSDLAILQGKLQKSRVKNVILAGPYIAQIANTPGFFQMAGTLDGLEDAWRAFGWDLIGLNTEWTGADPYVQGFACNPQAIGLISGLPLNPVEGIPGNVIQVGTAVLPGVDIAIATYLWMDANARTMRATYDIMLGATAIDTTAGVIIKSQ
jgi:ATP-dependent protease ClpP protease subunit